MNERVIEEDLSPLMRQYREIKRAYRHAILFFRVGDFYEMFYEDAQEAARLLAITLTTRDKSKADPVPLCGVPFHAASGYIAKLLNFGKTVALCEQVEDPKTAKGLVRREVVRLYTPGTLVDPELLDPSEPNFLASVVSHGSSGSSASLVGLAALDLSTGDFWVREWQGDRAVAALQDELARLEPKEVLCPERSPLLAPLHGLKGRVCPRPDSDFDVQASVQVLLDQFRVGSLRGFGCEELPAAVGAAGAAIRYLRDTQLTAPLGHVNRLKVLRSEEDMHLDRATIRNLELVKSLTDDRQGPTLLAVLDRTVTAMGSRLLREWILRPLLAPARIGQRLDAVSELVDHLQARVALRTALRSIHDLARLISRVSLGVATPRDVGAIKASLATLPRLRELLSPLHAALLNELRADWDDGEDMHELLGRALVAEPPATSREGGVLQDGYHPEVDALRQVCREGKGWIAQLEARERSRTGIDSLKIRYNQVFGYYLEVTKSNLHRVPSDYSRKQTLANAERYMTAELKDLEQQVLGAEGKLKLLEQELFAQLIELLARETARLQRIAIRLAVLDVLSSLAETAALHGYVRPELTDGGRILIEEGRHPVVERLPLNGGFVPNDTLLDLEANRLLILTGPNMAGKSTYLRQVALIVLMAQIGSFVPASRAAVGVVDRIFTRVGASDNLAEGQSTFMVEMTETAQILNCATARSLILLDEIGRGTSTYDGLSIAWAVAEYILDRSQLGARTLFATHYHELTELAMQREGVVNYSVAVREQGEQVLFLRKIVRGGADRSYGIQVARLAGLPGAVIQRAQSVLAQLEGAKPAKPPESAGERSQEETFPRAHPMIEEVRQMDLFSMTPLEALNRLAELQRRLADQPVSGW